MRDVASVVAYVGGVVALVLLWHLTGHRRFSSHRWFVIVPVAILGATAANAIPTYLANVRFAATIGERLDVATAVGEIFGLGVANGAIVGVVAIIGNIIWRRADANRAVLTPEDEQSMGEPPPRAPSKPAIDREGGSA